uniref:RING-type domain-containing protein n=1 Tax=Panagrolaimus davidi TaxID=227884 RepID=A0A914PGY0_9BILA
MSQKSPEIGQCSICLSNLNISNIYEVSKCGHTFHQKCILQWISIAKNCPLCRTNAVQWDIIKSFIQENNAEIVIPKKKEILPYIETKHTNYCHRIMKECNCEIFRYGTGDLEYKCSKDFDINIYSGDKIQITLTDEIMITINPSSQFEILRQKTEDESIVLPNGKRFEYFYQGIRNGRKEFFVETPREGTFRSNEDFVQQDVNCIKFCFPKFTINRSLRNGESVKVTIRVYTNDSNKSLKIKICPEHQSFYVEHIFEKKINRCTNSEFLCDHLQE